MLRAQWQGVKGLWYGVGKEEVGPEHRRGRLSHIKTLQRLHFPLLEERAASS